MSTLDETLSPENFPPCDRLLAAAGSELAALVADRDALRIAARKVLKCAHVDVPAAKLSDDDLDWLCPKCNQKECAPDCTRNALLGALDELEIALSARAEKGRTT